MTDSSDSTATLASDLAALGTAVKQPLAAIADHGRNRISQLRSGAEQTLSVAKARFADLQDVAATNARAAQQASDDYVRANPWRVIALSAAAGLVLGLLLARGGDSKP